MAETAKKNLLFAKIENAQDATKTIRDAAIGFFCVAALQAVLGLFMAPALIVDAVVLAVLAGVLLKWHSRVAAVLLLVVSAGEAVVTLLNRVGAMSQGGKNVFLSVIMLIAAVRAVEATVKLHGKFRRSTSGPASPRSGTVRPAAHTPSASF
jgi:uncharacterized membrane protein